MRLILSILRRRLSAVIRRPSQIGPFIARVISLLLKPRRLLWRIASTDAGDEYRRWIDRFDAIGVEDRLAIDRAIERLSWRPLLSLLLVDAQSDQQALNRLLDSLERQRYKKWEILIFCDASPAGQARLEASRARGDPRVRTVTDAASFDRVNALNAAIAQAQGEYVCIVDDADVLAEHSLFIFAEHFSRHSSTVVAYADEDRLDRHSQRSFPDFKPAWNPDLLCARCYLGGPTFYRRETVLAAGGLQTSQPEWDLALRVTHSIDAAQIAHLPFVLLHRSQISTHQQPQLADDEAVTRHISRHGIHAQAVKLASGAWHIKRSLDRWPTVSIIIPTKGNLPVLRRCLDRLLSVTLYPSMEVIVIDNQSGGDRVARIVASCRTPHALRVEKFDCRFNFSAITNYGASISKGRVLCLLNDDTEVLLGDWLQELVAQATRPEIGAVGALLYYPDGYIQHAGMILGVTGAGTHAHRQRPPNYPQKIGRPLCTQNYSAVSAACMAVARAKFEEVGGFDEAFAVSCNDIDFCLRLMARGYRNLLSAYAGLLHVESASRGYDYRRSQLELREREIALLQQRWGAQLRNDPSYNPNLALDRECFGLAFPPRVDVPWLHHTGARDKRPAT